MRAASPEPEAGLLGDRTGKEHAMTVQPPAPEQLRDAWDAIAAGYDEYITPLSIRHGQEALRRVDVRPGTRFLDVAAGSGALSIPAARRGARVTAADISPTMIERLAARAAAEGLTGIAGTVTDARALDLPDGAFDVAASQNGVTMVPDLDTALAEMVRVTRPGGTVLIAAFGALEKAEFLGFFISAVKAAVPGFTGPPLDPPPPPFQLADPGAFHDRLTGAGLTRVTVDTVTWDMPVDSAAHLWSEVTSSNPIGARLVAPLSAEQRRDVLSVLDGVLRERSGGGAGAVLQAEVNIGTGTR
jgi:ubiquinone/menaquinone biosynthesis C-methylase UbiE